MAGCSDQALPTSPSSSLGSASDVATSPIGSAASLSSNLEMEPPSLLAQSTVRLLEDFGGRTLFPSSNWWNQDISRAPVDARSSAYINFIGRERTLHPDFGPPPYGIPYMGVGSTEPRLLHHGFTWWGVGRSVEGRYKG
ncbi:MAG: hypothetical protein EXQ55_08170 [Acidobacteria bacterium]|nr:hypothetical protein [Acidobacteriota bacterium]